VSAHGGGSALTGAYTPLVSGEAVAIDLRVARIGSRAVAAIIDFAVQLLALGFIEAVLLNLVSLGAAALRAVLIIVLVVVFIGYPVVMEAAWGGRTLGKAAMGLRAARDDGGPLRFRHALVRGLIGAFVEKPGITLSIAAIASSLSSTQGKRLGDLAAGTVVLQVRLPTTGAYVPPMPPPLAGWAATLDLSRFDDRLALQARQFLGRAGQLNPDARERLGAALVAAVTAVVAPPPPPGTPGWAYLTAVLAERRRRDEARHFPPAAPGMPVPPPLTPQPPPAPTPAPAPTPPPAQTHTEPPRNRAPGGFVPPA
jgi:uncharacterized RDD family membrane protein YckC